MPTVCDLIHAERPAGIDGISYLPTLLNIGNQQKHESLYFEFHEQGGKQAVIKDRWKLVHLNVNKPAQERYELYNLTADPGENSNVLSLYPEKVDSLKKIMSASHTKNENWQFAFEKK